MQNIHLIQTDKPSRLVKNDKNLLKLCIQTLPLDREINCFPQNIYITSDEEIKEGDWCLLNNRLVVRYFKPPVESKSFKKIILTTDQDLIKDGVQAINDEFLEWFIKNPSCEEVDIKKIYLSNDGQWKEVLLPSEWEVNTKVKLLIIPKEETLEDVAKRYIEEYDVEHYISIEDFIMGAKWQQEQDKNKFSEEDMLLAFQTGRNFQLTGENNFKELIEQLKK